MARPPKEGLEYYPKDTNTHSNRKIRRLIKEFGAKGYLVWDYLLCLIYANKGYWVQYDDDLLFDVSDFLQCGISTQLVKEVIDGCVRIGLFNEDLYNVSKKITSKGIQEVFLKVRPKGVIDENLRVMKIETPENDPESTQRKEKKSKEEEIKEKQELFKNSIDPFIGKYSNDLLNDFYRYWSEANCNTARLKWELQDTFEISKRLATFYKRNNKNTYGSQR